MTDLLKDFKNIVTPHTDIPECFIEASGYSIISCCLGRFYMIQNSSGKRPNLYIILSSAPAIGRRSEMLKLTNIVKHSAFKSYIAELCDGKIDEDLSKNQVTAHMLESGSVEGFIDDIIYYKNKGVKSFCLSSPEFGRILSAMREGKGYMHGFDEALCKLWSGEPYYQSFSHRTKENYNPRYLTSGLYFNVFSTTQKLKNYLDLKMSQTGLVRRLLLVSIEGDDLKYYKPPLGRNTEKMEADLSELGTRIGSEMAHVHKSSKELKLLHLEEPAKVIINNGAMEWEKKAREDDENTYYLYQITRWEHILKVAANDTLSKLSDTITSNNVRNAIQFVDNATKDIRKILEEICIPDEKKKSEEQKRRILKLIRKGADRTKLQQGMTPYNVKKTLLNQYLIELHKDEEISDEDYNRLFKP